MEEVILIDKPAGMTSFGVVARVRRVLTEKAGHKVKVGHTGTLDPFATGLLILLVGKSTKRSEEFLRLDKEYEAEIILGKVSTTGDPEGEITSTGGEIPSEEAVRDVLAGLEGDLLQKPPIYSAIKVNGQRAYKLARKGQTPDMLERKVAIYSLELISYSYPSLKIRARVSSGTYIRTLAEDIGKRLGLGAYTKELRRIKVGDYDIKNATKIEE